MFTYYWRRPRWSHAAWLAGYRGGSRMPVDVDEDDEAYRITAAVPGLKPEDVEVQVLEDVVTLRLRPPEAETKDRDYLLRELGDGSLERSFRLPAAIEPDKAEAVVENGLLRLTLPKAEAVRPKTIEVKSK